MAFNIFGTYTTAQWNEFTAYVAIQRVDLQARFNWLSAEQARVGIFNTDYGNDNFPTPYNPDDPSTGFTCIPDSSYGAKLLSAYRVLGGVPEDDMLLRTSDQPVFLTRGTSAATGEDASKTGYSDLYSNGRRDRGGMRFDRDLGLKVNLVKNPFLETIKRKRERLEYKIKRALDYSDQLQNEMNSITALLGTGPGSLDDLLSQVTSQANLPGSFGVVNNPNDKFGLGIGRVGDQVFSDSANASSGQDERLPK